MAIEGSSLPRNCIVSRGKYEIILNRTGIYRRPRARNMRKIVGGRFEQERGRAPSHPKLFARRVSHFRRSNFVFRVRVGFPRIIIEFLGNVDEQEQFAIEAVSTTLKFMPG